MTNRKIDLKWAGYGVALAAALALAGCGDKAENKAADAASATPDATAGGAGSTPSTDASSAAPAAPDAMDHEDDAMDEEMTRHHRQQMDHDEMRKGGVGQGNMQPADQATTDQPAPMKDM